MSAVTQSGDTVTSLRERVDAPDVSREGPFDVHRVRHHPDTPLRSRQDSQGCPFRITSYDLEIEESDFSQDYGVQLHDPRLPEYVGAPKSARLLSRSPEYWVEDMGREKTLSAALQLQHDAGLILSNVQILQQLMTAIHVCQCDGGRPWPSAISDTGNVARTTVRPSSPSSSLHDGDGSVAPSDCTGDSRTASGCGMRGLHVLRRLLPGDASVSREATLD